MTFPPAGFPVVLVETMNPQSGSAVTEGNEAKLRKWTILESATVVVMVKDVALPVPPGTEVTVTPTALTPLYETETMAALFEAVSVTLMV